MNKPSYANLLFGLTLMLLGGGLLLGTLGVIDARSTLGTWWPVVIMLIGVASLLSNPRVWLWPTLIIAFGVLLQLRELDVVTFNVWNVLLPAVLIIFGLSVMLGRGNKVQPSSKDSFDLFTAFAGIASKSTSKNFKGGRASAMFGGIDLDLREAVLTTKEPARLELFAAFGGIDLKVPEGWNVVTSGIPLFGGWSDKSLKPAKDGAPTLYIRATCLFGGVDIKH